MTRKIILLINPWIYDFAAYDFWNKPIGLLSLAALLRKNNETVYFIDCLDPYHPDMRYGSQIHRPKRKGSGEGSYARQIIPRPEPLKNIPKNYHRYGITPEILHKSVLSVPTPDIIMMTSMMTYWYPAIFEMVQLFHEIFPCVPVVLGGNYVSLLPQHAAQSGADFCLPGPAELSLPSLWKSLFGEDLHFLPDRNNLDSLPYPAFDLARQNDQIPIITSLGCPYRCPYCASHLLYDRFLRRDPIKVATEIEYWFSRFGIRHFSFYDDAFLAKPEEMAIPLMKEMIRKSLPIDFHCPNGLHLRNVNADISNLMFKARFKTLRFGFETSDVMRQESMGGKADNKELTAAVNCLKMAGYERKDIGIYLLSGLPGQCAEEVKESIRFVQSSGAKPILAEYSPIPGTDLWREAVAMSPYPIESEPLFHNNSLLPCRNSSLTYEMYQRLKRMTRQFEPDQQCSQSIGSG